MFFADESTFILWFALFTVISVEVATAMATARIIFQITTLMIISKWDFKAQRMKRCHRQQWRKITIMFMTYLKSWLKSFQDSFLKRSIKPTKKITQYKSGTPATYLKKVKGKGQSKISTTYSAHKKATCPWLKGVFPLNILAMESSDIGRQHQGVYTEFDTNAYQIRIDSHCSYCITNTKTGVCEHKRSWWHANIFIEGHSKVGMAQ